MPESMTDQSVTAWLARLVAKVEEEQQNAAEALHRLARAAEADAASVVTVPPEAWFATYRKQAEEVGRVLDRLDAARYDVTVCSQVRAARLATRDTESSASRQHYIDTGDYLDKDTVDADIEPEPALVGPLRNELWRYPSFLRQEGACRLRTFRWGDKRIAVVTELPDNPGPSVTNSAEAIATKLAGEEPYDGLIEHYPARCPNRPASLDEILIDSRSRASWRPIADPLRSLLLAALT